MLHRNWRCDFLKMWHRLWSPVFKTSQTRSGNFRALIWKVSKTNCCFYRVFIRHGWFHSSPWFLDVRIFKFRKPGTTRYVWHVRMTAVIRKGSTPAMVSSVECSLMAICCILSIGTGLFVNLEVSHLLGVREDSSSLEICWNL